MGNDDVERRDAMSGDVLSHFSPGPLLPALVGLLALNNPPPAGSGDEPVAVDFRLRAWRRFACSFRCRRSLAIARSLLRLCSAGDAVLLGVSYSTVKAFQCCDGAGRLITSFAVPPALAISSILHIAG